MFPKTTKEQTTREEKENRRILEMIKKKDERALGKWLRDFGKGGWSEILKEEKQEKEILEKDNPYF